MGKTEELQMMLMGKNKKKGGDRNPEAVFDKLVPFIIGAFFCFLFAWYGVGQYPDSVTYMGYTTDREPLYPMFLMLCRAAAGEAHFLWLAVLLQNVLAFFSFWYLYRFWVRQFRLNLLFRVAALLIILAPHLLVSLFSASGIILTNAVLSEGLTVSLYPLFAVLLLEAFYREKKGSYVITSYIVAILLSLIRGQLMPLLLVWLMTTAVSVIRTGRNRNAARAGGQKYSKKAYLLMIFMLSVFTVFGFVIRQSVIHVYHTAMTDGVVRSNTGGNVTFLTNTLYCADEQAVSQAAEKLSGSEAALLYEMYADMRRQGLGEEDAGSGFHARILHHEDSHDKIKFELLGEQLFRTVRSEWDQLPQAELMDRDGARMSVEEDEIAGRLMKALLPHCIGSYLTTYLYVAAGGFVRTVSLLSPVFSIYALFIYAAAVVLMCVLFRKAQGRAAAWLMAIVLLMTAANVCATALTIMCLSRYMIYNMSLFYLAGLVCVWEAYRIRRGGTSGAEICTQPE